MQISGHRLATLELEMSGIREKRGATSYRLRCAHPQTGSSLPRHNSDTHTCTWECMARTEEQMTNSTGGSGRRRVPCNGRRCLNPQGAEPSEQPRTWSGGNDQKQMSRNLFALFSSYVCLKTTQLVYPSHSLVQREIPFGLPFNKQPEPWSERRFSSLTTCIEANYTRKIQHSCTVPTVLVHPDRSVRSSFHLIIYHYSFSYSKLVCALSLYIPH